MTEPEPIGHPSRWSKMAPDEDEKKEHKTSLLPRVFLDRGFWALGNDNNMKFPVHEIEGKQYIEVKIKPQGQNVTVEFPGVIKFKPTYGLSE